MPQAPEETFLRSNVRCLNIARLLDIRHFVSYSLRIGRESSYCIKTVGGAGVEITNKYNNNERDARQQSHRRPRNAVTQSPALNLHSTNTAPSMRPILVGYGAQKANS